MCFGRHLKSKSDSEKNHSLMQINQYAQHTVQENEDKPAIMLIILRVSMENKYKNGNLRVWLLGHVNHREE